MVFSAAVVVGVVMVAAAPTVAIDGTRWRGGGPVLGTRADTRRRRRKLKRKPRILWLGLRG